MAARHRVPGNGQGAGPQDREEPDSLRDAVRAHRAALQSSDEWVERNGLPLAQYDVFPTPAGGGYLRDVQGDLLEGLHVRAVVPLLPREAAPVAARRRHILAAGNDSFRLRASAEAACGKKEGRPASIQTRGHGHDLQAGHSPMGNPGRFSVESKNRCRLSRL